MRDLYSKHLDMPVMVELTQARMARVRDEFPKALKTTELFALVMPEDSTGMYELAGTLNIPVALVVIENLTTGIVRPGLEFAGQAFIVTNDAITDLLDRVRCFHFRTHFIKTKYFLHNT